MDEGDLPSALIQQQLISDRWAPAAVLPIWDWPGWHPDWQEAQARGLRNLDAVRVDGSLDPQVCADLARPQADQAPPEPQAQALRGRLRCEHDHGTFQLERSEGATPLITLEPGVNEALAQLDDGLDVELIAVHNPWGPWWRVIQLADLQNRREIVLSKQYSLYEARYLIPGKLILKKFCLHRRFTISRWH